jgi:hypothetical protein
LKLALDDLIAEYHMETSSFAKRMDEIFNQARSAPVQEPVAWLKRHELADLQTCNHRRLGADSPRIWAPNAPDAPPPELDLVAVYTTPPAQPAVPDAIIEAGESPEFRDGWNQCRETMLQMLKARTA